MRKAFFSLIFFFVFCQSISAAEIEPNASTISDSLLTNNTSKIVKNDSSVADIAGISIGAMFIAPGVGFTVLAITADPDSWNLWPLPAALFLSLGIAMVVDNIISLARHRQQAYEQKKQQSSNFIITPQFDWVHSGLGIGMSIKF
jgi:hypothetical protein